VSDETQDGPTGDTDGRGPGPHRPLLWWSLFVVIVLLGVTAVVLSILVPPDSS
jgi:hypothetical protein